MASARICKPAFLPWASAALALALFASSTSAGGKAEIVPIAYLSGGISFNTWIDLITLTLAPLLAHLAGGAPRTTLLAESGRKPRWHDRLCHYNPTSILWRYYAIADRRLRSKTWTARDMATANTVFWTAHGWDGSEGMASTCEQHLRRIPRSNKMIFFSWQTLQTIIVTLQGAQAMYVLIGIRTGHINLITRSPSTLSSPLWPG